MNATFKEVLENMLHQADNTPTPTHSQIINNDFLNNIQKNLEQKAMLNHRLKQERQERDKQHAHRQKYGRFDLSRKPDPASFYYKYGFELKQKNTLVKCPFHDDKTASLSINRETGAYYCFACGAKGGDVISFYRQYHHTDFVTACQNLDIPKE